MWDIVVFQRFLRQDLGQLQILQRWPGVVVHGYARGRWWASRGYQLLSASDDGDWRDAGQVMQGPLKRVVGRVPLLNLALRLGVHLWGPLGDDAEIAVVSGQLLRREKGGKWQTALKFEGFRKPTRHGVLVDDKHRVFVAMYSLNRERKQAIHLWRSDDGGKTFQIVNTFAAGLARHIHFIQQDQLDGSLWLGTGDTDAESAIYRSVDGGLRWHCVGGGSQLWRAIAVVFQEDAVIWGTDAGSDAGAFANRMVRWDRQTQELLETQQVQGPVHGITALKNGSLLAATGLEGGANEVDNRVHMWHSGDGRTWQEIASWRNGLQPKRVQYGVCHFAHGLAQAPEVRLTLRGILGDPLTSCAVELKLP